LGQAEAKKKNPPGHFWRDKWTASSAPLSQAEAKKKREEEWGTEQETEPLPEKPAART